MSAVWHAVWVVFGVTGACWWAGMFVLAWWVAARTRSVRRERAAECARSSARVDAELRRLLEDAS